MKDFYDGADAFGKICGNCAGIDINSITESDIRAQADAWGGCSDEMVNAAIEYLREAQIN